MNTISRAIVILGSNVVRELTIACSFFESIISPENKHRANKEIGHAIHAAVQAKAIAIACNDPSPEEVFIATLLNNIGSIAFWCFGGKQCKYITELLQSGNYSSEQAEKKVLGLTLKELGKNISKSWGLGGLIEEAITNPSSSHIRPKIVHLAKEIVLAVDEGWESKPMKTCLKKLEQLTGQDPSISKPVLKKNRLTAVNIACKFGAHDASQFIQTDQPSELVMDPSDETVDSNKIQFHILQEITEHISGAINLNLLFEMVVEGIHRGLGMDRTLFCLLSSDKKTLNEKLVIGWLKALNSQKITLEVSSVPTNLFYKAVYSDSGLWVNTKSDSTLFTPSVINSIGRTECFLMPIHADNKPIDLY